MAFGSDAFFYVPGETRGTLAISYLDTYTEAQIPAKIVLKMMTTNAATMTSQSKSHDTPAMTSRPQTSSLTCAMST